MAFCVGVSVMAPIHQQTQSYDQLSRNSYTIRDFIGPLRWVPVATDRSYDWVWQWRIGVLNKTLYRLSCSWPFAFVSKCDTQDIRIHRHTHRHRQTDRQTDRNTHTHTHTQTYKHTHTHTHTHTHWLVHMNVAWCACTFFHSFGTVTSPTLP